MMRIWRDMFWLMMIAIIALTYFLLIKGGH